uniref:Uncharacterized protein n=1 Tax=Solanum tuberosum TaxID=4113 RepID=M1DTJ8_SOLTU
MPNLCSKLMLKCLFATMKAKEQGKDTTGQKRANKLKILRKAILVITKTTRRAIEWLFSSPKVPACQPWGRTDLATEMGSRWIIELIRDSNLDRLKSQNLED